MKIYLTYGAEQNDLMPEYEYCNYAHTDGAAYPSQVDEIYGPIVLNYIPLLDVMVYVDKYKKLLKSGGELIIGGVDCYILSKLTLARDLTEKQLNELLFSDPKFKALHSLQAVKALLQSRGFSINEINIEENEARFTIKAIKV